MGNKHKLQMQRRNVPIQMPVGKQSEISPSIRLNQYTCWTCNGVITTIDRDEGVTPAMLACRVTEGCDGTMHSHRYMVDSNLTPDYEWYTPAKLPRDPDMREYVERGGLLIRKIEQ